jgi:hypothetical protein
VSSERININNTASERESSSGPGQQHSSSHTINTSHSGYDEHLMGSNHPQATSPPSNSNNNATTGRGGMKRSPSGLKSTTSFHNSSGGDLLSNTTLNRTSSGGPAQFSLHRTHNSTESMTSTGSNNIVRVSGGHLNANNTDSVSNSASNNYSAPVVARLTSI